MNPHSFNFLAASTLGLLSLATPAVAQPLDDFFRCRLPVVSEVKLPSVTVAKYTNEREGGYEEWVFDPEGQRVFNQPVSFLSYSVDRDGEFEMDNHYMSVVMPSANWDDIRRAVEQQQGYRCSIHPVVATEYSCRAIKTGDPRSIMVAKANGQNNRANLSEGIVFTCDFLLSGRERVPVKK